MLDMSPFPAFWTNDTVLFQKYLESKYLFHPHVAQWKLWERFELNAWRTVKPPSTKSEYLQDFLEWRGQCKWWWVGHSSAGGRRILAKNARNYRRIMVDRFGGDIEAFSKEMERPLRFWSDMYPPSQSGLRYPMDSKIALDFLEYAKTCPVEDRITANVDGHFWRYFLVPKYSYDISRYNKAHGTDFYNYNEVFLNARAPVDNKKMRSDWEDYVRNLIVLEYVRLSPDLTDSFRGFVQDTYEDIRNYNNAHQTSYESFNEVPFPEAMPGNRPGQLDFEAFLKNSELCPTESIRVYGPRQAFEEFVAKRRNLPLEEIRPLIMPIKEADWHDCRANSRELRWEFTTRNYKNVLDYVLMYGRGIRNTAIYCALAIGLALLVNPLAAYALSRYKPSATYKILLFCMATMAFPNAVTMIPSFLLLKRFPLWPLLGGCLGFGLAIWLITKFFGNLKESIRLVLSLGVGITVGVWLVPTLMTGKPYTSLLNTYAALVLPSMANGYSIFLLKGFFDSLPRELYEAADLDGASEWTKFWSFTMNLSKPILAVIALSAFVAAYSAFMFALIIIPDKNMWTMMVWIFQLQRTSHQAVVYASLVIAAIPTFLVFLFCQNIIMRGIVVPVEK